MQNTPDPLSILMLGATGAVGTSTLQVLLKTADITRLTLLGRRPVDGIEASFVHQHMIDVSDTTTYEQYLTGHQVAICTLGVGQPSKVSKEHFLKIDKQAVLDFAIACKAAGVKHFELLSSVGINANSSSFYLRTKGELVDELKKLNFERLSIFQPSMILTPTNRYGISQGIVLKVWPLIDPILRGSWKKYRGIEVAQLGQAIANNIYQKKQGFEVLTWEDFQELSDIIQNSVPALDK